jgi:4-aminobutyrate aminotransferase
MEGALAAGAEHLHAHGAWQARPPTLHDRLRSMYGADELLPGSVVAVDAEGVYVRDEAGREYMDCASGTFDQPLGYRHPALVEAIRTQSEKLAYVGSPFVADILLQLADKLVEISPRNLSHVHLRDITGSTAIEGAIKIAQTATGKRDIITLFGSHHGQTAMTTELSGNSFRRELYPAAGACALHVPSPYCYRCFYRRNPADCGLQCADSIEAFIEYASSGSVAAVLVEPVQGNGGNVMPPPGYFKRLREICDRHGMLLIVDEVQTGMGRLGTMFATDYFDIDPHILVLAKGLGGPVPRGAILVEEGLQRMPRYQHSFTGGSSLISAATALATIRVLEGPGFLARVARSGARLGQMLRALATRFAFIGDVRGAGYMWGLEIVGPNREIDVALTNRIVRDSRLFGLILRSSRYGRGNVVKVRPPLIMTDVEIDEMMARITALLESVR